MSSPQNDGSGTANSRRRPSVVKRNLFGTLDHQQIQDDLKRELKRITDEKSRKWNFDFENFKPLPGRFKWERVGKRLQTRRSPTEQALSAENICQTRTVEPVHVSTRYNLRTREKELEHISDLEFRPIEPAPAERCKRFRDSHVENGTTGELNFVHDVNLKIAKSESQGKIPKVDCFSV